LLKELKTKVEAFTINTDKYQITGVPFYNMENENEFYKTLGGAFEV